MKRHYLMLTFSLSIVLSGCSPHLNLNAPFGSRPPNEHELFYTAIAVDFGDFKTCLKVSKRALDERGPDMGNTGWRVVGQRSACYFYAALKTKDLKLCDSVEKISTVPANKAGISPEKCREILQNNSQYPYKPMLSPYSVGGLMKEMGYREEDVYAAEYTENSINNSVYRFYKTIRDTDPFKAKVRSLVSYDEVYSKDRLRPANEDEILTQMFAVENSLPDFCAKVSPNSYVEIPVGLRWSLQVTPRLALRNDCFYAVAQNAHRVGVCGRIAKFETNQNGVFSKTQKDCEMALHIQERDKSWRGQYPPEYFPTIAPFLGVLQRLGYAKPFLASDNQADWNHFYVYLMAHAPLEQEREFLKRVEALPSFAD